MNKVVKYLINQRGTCCQAWTKTGLAKWQEDRVWEPIWKEMQIWSLCVVLPEWLDVQRKITAGGFCSSPSRWKSVQVSVFCWPDTAPSRGKGPMASVLPSWGDRLLPKIMLCQNQTDISGMFTFQDEEYFHHTAGKSWMDAELGSSDNSRCKKRRFWVGTDSSQLVTSSQVRDETANSLCGGLGNIYCTGEKYLFQTHQPHL